MTGAILTEYVVRPGQGPRRPAVIGAKDTADVAIGYHNTNSEAHLPCAEA